MADVRRKEVSLGYYRIRCVNVGRNERPFTREPGTGMAVPDHRRRRIAVACPCGVRAATSTSTRATAARRLLLTAYCSAYSCFCSCMATAGAGLPMRSSPHGCTRVWRAESNADRVASSQPVHRSDLPGGVFMVGQRFCSVGHQRFRISRAYYSKPTRLLTRHRD